MCASTMSQMITDIPGSLEYFPSVGVDFAGGLFEEPRPPSKASKRRFFFYRKTIKMKPSCKT